MFYFFFNLAMRLNSENYALTSVDFGLILAYLLSVAFHHLQYMLDYRLNNRNIRVSNRSEECPNIVRG